MAKKYLDYDGLLYFWQKIKTLFVTDVTYTSSSRKIQKTKAGTTSDVVTLSKVATSNSYNDLDNKPTIPSGVEKSTTTPKMDGTASVGSEVKFAAGDHVHPSDTSRVPTTRTINGKALSSDIDLAGDDITVSSTITDQTLDEALAELDERKVEKVTGKGLSTNDYTTAEKNKLAGIEAGAEVNQNAYGTVIVGSTSLDADAESASIEFVAGDNITLTADVSTPAIQISATDTTYSAGTSSIIETGTNTTNRVWSAKILADYVKAQIQTAVTGAASFQGTAPSPFAPTNYKRGYYWVVGTAGTYAGQVCEPGDMIFAFGDGMEYDQGDFNVIQTNLDITSITNAEIDTIVAS